MTDESKRLRAASLNRAFNPKPSGPALSPGGFWPPGFFDLTAVRDRAGIKNVGSWLAGGGLIAAVKTTEGITPIDSGFWISPAGPETLRTMMLQGAEVEIYVCAPSPDLSATLRAIVEGDSRRSVEVAPIAPWSRAEGEKLALWVSRSDVTAEAERRAKATGQPLSEGRIVREIEDMARSEGFAAADGSVARLRRRNRQS